VFLKQNCLIAGENGPWHGWIFSDNAQTLAPAAADCNSPNGAGSGIWMSGMGRAAEVLDPVHHHYGRIFVATGNGDYTAATPSLSANGNSQAMIRAVETDAHANQNPAILMAHSATDPGTTLYSSATSASRDPPRPAVKFAVPTMAKGKVYVGTETRLSVFGLLSSEPVAATHSIAPGSVSFDGSVVAAIFEPKLLAKTDASALLSPGNIAA